MMEKTNVTNFPDESADEFLVLLQRRSTKAYAQIGWLLVSVGFLGFLVWSAIAPLDQGVVADGRVTVNGQRKTIQHVDGGIIREIYVTEGAEVNQGDRLISLENTVLNAQAMAARSDYLNAQLEMTRLEVEQSLFVESNVLSIEQKHLHAIALPKNSSDQGSTGNIESTEPTFLGALLEDSVRLHQSLLFSRHQALQQNFAILNEQGAAAHSRLEGYIGLRHSQQRQKAFLQQRIDGLKSLANQNYVSKNTLLERQESLAELEGEMHTTQGNIIATQRQLAEIKNSGALKESTHLNDIREQLASLRNQQPRRYQAMVEANAALARSEIIAPVAGTIVNLSTHTINGVIRSSESLMEIVPNGESLIVEARIPIESIDSVYPNQSVDLMFSAFNQASTPKVQGKLVHISADRLEDPTSGQPYYGASIEVSSTALGQLNGFTIIPGMPVQAFIKNGERTLLSYLFKPFTDRIPMAFSGE